MNKKRIEQSQSGFAPLAIIVVLAVVLLGALGLVYWQNFMQSKTDTAGTINPTIINTYKTYTDEKYNYSFKYLDKWTLGAIKATLPEDQYWNRSMDVKNENGETVATLTFGVSGLGGTCSGLDESVIPTYTVLDSEQSSVIAKKSVAFDFIVTPSRTDTGAYSASYGLTDTYTRLGDFEHVCLAYNLFSSNINDSYGNSRQISFGNGVLVGGKQFASLDDAKRYIESNEYKEIKKMLLSFSF